LFTFGSSLCDFCYTYISGKCFDSSRAKQANAILSNLSQMLPDSQPQSAPEIALLQSRMMIGKTVDDLNLQTRIKKITFLWWEGLSRLMGKVPGEIDVSRFYLKAK
jgi:tyrosine-protein kinase Etk/Wzc